MEENIEVKHKGVTIKITSSTSVKNGVAYKSYQIADYCTGKRKRWTFADLNDAKKKARDIAEFKGGDQGGLLALAPVEQAIQSALETLVPTATRIDRAAYIFADACNFVEPSEIVIACQYYRQHKPDTRFCKVSVNEGIEEFTSQHRASAIRRRNVSNYLSAFARKFGDRVIADVKSAEIEKWFAEHQWEAKTVNDYRQATSQFWKFAIKNNWAIKNPMTEIKRLKIARGTVPIYTPVELRRQLSSLQIKAPELVAAAVIGAFGGLRISEIARVDWTQINHALQTGFIELSGTQTKTQEPRYVPVSDNLKAWLLTCRKESGPVIPLRWSAPGQKQLNRVNELGQYIARKTATKWQRNGWRHSYGTYHFKLYGDPHRTITAMGTSIDKLNRNYMSKAQIVSKALAAEWFSIMPSPGEENIIAMPETASNTEASTVAPIAG